MLCHWIDYSRVIESQSFNASASSFQFLSLSHYLQMTLRHPARRLSALPHTSASHRLISLCPKLTFPLLIFHISVPLALIWYLSRALCQSSPHLPPLLSDCVTLFSPPPSSGHLSASSSTSTEPLWKLHPPRSLTSLCRLISVRCVSDEWRA